MLDASQHGRIADFITVQVQDGQNGSIGDWVEKLVDCQAVARGPVSDSPFADHAGDDQAGIIKCRPESMAERITQLATLMNRTRGGGRTWLEIPPGNENCVNSFSTRPHPGDVRINFAPGAFEVNIAHNRRAAVTGTGDVKHVQVVLLDDPVQNAHKWKFWPGVGPVSDHQGLHVGQFQRDVLAADCRRDKSGRPRGSWRPQ